MANNGPGWFRPGMYKVAGTAETFKGTPSRIDLGPDVKYYDEKGRELLPLTAKEPEPLTEEQLFWGVTWSKQ